MVDSPGGKEEADGSSPGGFRKSAPLLGEKRWERFGRRPSSLIGPAGPSGLGAKRRSMTNLKPDSEALQRKLSNSKIASPSAGGTSSTELPLALEQVAQGGIRGSERCVLAIRVTKLTLPDGDPDGDATPLSMNRGVSHSADHQVDDRKRRILALCEGKKSSSMLKLHKMTDLGNGKVSVSRTWWLSELTQIDGLGEDVEVGSSFILTFGGNSAPSGVSPKSSTRNRRFGYQMCASKIGRAPPVRGLKILEMQKVADMVSPRHYTSGNESERRGGLAHSARLVSPESPQQGGTGPSFAPIKSPRALLGPFAKRMFKEDLEADVSPLPGSIYDEAGKVTRRSQSSANTNENPHQDEVLSPKMQAAEDRVMKKIRAQERAALRDKEARGRAIQAYSDALDQMLGPAESMSDSQRAEHDQRRLVAEAAKKEEEARIAKEKEIEELRLTEQQADDLETVFNMYSNGQAGAVQQKEFVDYLGKKLRQLEKENIQEIIHSESEVGAITESLQNLAAHIDGTKLWLNQNESRLALCVSSSTTLESELLVHEMQLQNNVLLEDKITEIEEAITLTDYERFTIKYATREKMMTNENRYLVDEIAPVLRSLKQKLDYRPKHEAMMNFPVLKEGRGQLIEHRDTLLGDLMPVMEAWITKIPMQPKQSIPKHQTTSVIEFSNIMETVTGLDARQVHYVMKMYASFGSPALTNSFEAFDEVHSEEEDFRSQLNHALSILRPACLEESLTAYKLFAPSARILCCSPSSFIFELLVSQLSEVDDLLGAMVQDEISTSTPAVYLSAWAGFTICAAELKTKDGKYIRHFGEQGDEAFCQQALLSIIENRSLDCKNKGAVHAESIIWASTRAAEAVGHASLNPEGIGDAARVFRKTTSSLMDLAEKLLELIRDELKDNPEVTLIPEELRRGTSIRDVCFDLSDDAISQIAKHEVIDYVKNLCHRLVAAATKNIEIASQTSKYAQGDAIRIENYMLVVAKADSFPQSDFLRDLCELARKASRAALANFTHRLFKNHFGRAIDRIIAASQAKNYGTRLEKIFEQDFRHKRAVCARFQNDFNQMFCAESKELLHDRCWGELAHHIDLQLTAVGEVLRTSGCEDERSKLHEMSNALVEAIRSSGSMEITSTGNVAYV